MFILSDENYKIPHRKSHQFEKWIGTKHLYRAVVRWVLGGAPPKIFKFLEIFLFC